MTHGLILLVEDNVVNAKVVRIALELEGFTVLVASDAEKAMQVLVTQIPDCILMDLQLPGMSGLELIKFLKQQSRFSFIPIIAITAYGMTHDRIEIMKAGCDYYLIKPFSTVKLIQLIKSKMVSSVKI